MNYEFSAPAKDPASILDHAIDWSDWLGEGETIVGTPTVVSAPAGLPISAIDQANGIVSWRVSGGVLGADYIVTCQITTSSARIDERSILYRIRDR